MSSKLSYKIVRWTLSAVIPWLAVGALYAQQSRITGTINDGQTVVLPGHVRPEAQPQYDEGAVESTFQLPSITIHLKPSTGQQQSLNQLLGNQQNPASPQYHKWLTPEQYADQFGASSSDMAKITAWLQSHGFTVQLTARSRTWITFSGTAQQVQSALHTPIHRYNVSGEIHYANATNPSLPAAFAGMVSSIRGLNDFRWKPRNLRIVTPKETLGGTHYVVPDDWATIYDVAPLYSGGINGTGQSLVIVGQTQILQSDITAFRSQFNLPPINLQQVLVPGPNPGIADLGDLGESDLDIEWSGAVARNATIIFVYSPDVSMSLTYAVDADLAPVISMSYGECEQSDLVDLPTLRSTAQQANAEGITWVAPAGDSGAADCDDGVDIAQNGLAVDAPGSIPEVTSVGGTEFNEQGGTYWSSTNNADGASALSYIPEMVWNDTIVDQELSAGGGGSSLVFFKPVWQTGPGVPNDGARDVPDVAFNASAAHDPTYVYTDGSGGYFGGTSLGAPTMAGVVTLLNQYLVAGGLQQQPGVANINPYLYQLGRNSSAGVFHDVTNGSNAVPCVVGSPNCTTGSMGYDAAPSYDLASGWGSLNVYNFVHQWSSVAVPSGSAVVASVSQIPGPGIYGNAETVFEQPANNWSFTLTLTEEGPIPTTLTALTINGTDYSAQISSLFGTASIGANQSISAQITLSNLTVPESVPFTFSGVDASGRQWTEQVAIPFEGAETQLSIEGISNAAAGQLTFAPGEWVAIYGTGLATLTQSAGALPLAFYLAGFSASVNGFPAYPVYVSANQVNLQIPWETATGPAILYVYDAYTHATYNFQVSAAAPGLFEFTPGTVAAQDTNYNNIGAQNPARPGQTIIVYTNGLGRVSNRPVDGAAAAALPLSKTISTPTVTIGGQPATVTFSGLAPTLVSLYQLNVVVPENLGSGNQSIVVSIGGQTSNTSGLMIQ